jgi:hypothetical protein
MTEGKRRQRTPRERAEERLGIEQRRVAKLDKAIAKAELEVTALKAERTEAQERLEYAQRDPALGDRTLTESDGETEGTEEHG